MIRIGFVVRKINAVNQAKPSTEPDETDDPKSARSLVVVIVTLGLALPYLAIVLGWSLAPASIREHDDPRGESAAGIVRLIVLFATLIGFVPGTI
jgi:hypothetical protein